jgi:alpha-ketoglutarate-dependent taurine dioxygenase
MSAHPCVFAAEPGSRLEVLLRERKPALLEALRRSGALLFRGFPVHSAQEFAECAASLSTPLLEYRERSSPRSALGDRVYTSTDYPSDQSIGFHNENSYQASWPRHLFLHCRVAPRSGGETPLADVRVVLEKLGSSVRRKFAERGVLYIRNFSSELGLDWRASFQTSDRSQVEAHCRDNDIAFEWRGDGLRTRAVRRAIHAHPETGESVWFNHAAFFHASSLPDEAREVLRDRFAEDDLPNNTFYGDGSPIEDAVIAEIQACYAAAARAETWQVGDFLVVDNMLVAHARRPFQGPRALAFAMAGSHSGRASP